MKVTLVGTSCSWFERNNTSFILDDKMLFDISNGNYKKVIKYIDIFDLDCIIISHLHPDHVGDLYLITSRFIRESEMHERKTKLRVYAKEGTAQFIIDFNKLANSSPEQCSLEILQNYIEFIDIKDGTEFFECGYKIKTYRVDHGAVECYGFTFTDNNGKTVAFSGDTRYCENLEKMLSISSVAFVDMAASKIFKTHLDFNKFVELSKKYTNCKMIPIHTSDESQKLAIENNLNYVNDGDIINA